MALAVGAHVNLAVNALPRWTLAARAIDGVARRAAFVLVNLPAEFWKRHLPHLLVAFAQDGVVLLVSVDVYFSEHVGMAFAAVLGAEDLLNAGLGCREPELGIPTGNDVALQTKARNKEAVDHVL